MIIFFGYTARKNGCMESLNCFFFLIGVSFLNETDLLCVGTNIFVRNKKKMIYKKMRVENVQLNCLFTRLNRQEINMDKKILIDQ